MALFRSGDREGAHRLVQDDASPEGAYLHGIIHRDEGDFSNARYWFARARAVSERIGIDPMGLTDAAQKGERDVASEAAELDALGGIL